MKLAAFACALTMLGFGQVVMAASTYDGVYMGATTWAGNGNSRCNSGTPEYKITVRDGQFNYGSGGDRVPVAVGADGSFTAQAGQRYLQGKISAGRMTATTSGGPCNYIWDLRK